MSQLWDEVERDPITQRPVLRTRPENPCLRRFGPGPAGVTCQGCAHLRVREYSRRYYKCELRTNTHGAATDHRMRWPACGQYVERKDGT